MKETVFKLAIGGLFSAFLFILISDIITISGKKRRKWRE